MPVPAHHQTTMKHWKTVPHHPQRVTQLLLQARVQEGTQVQRTFELMRLMTLLMPLPAQSCCFVDGPGT